MPMPKARTSEGLRLYRVLPWAKTAAAGEPGHPLHLPRTQGAGRIDNPERYSVLYLGDSPVVAVAEAFADRAVWTPGMFEVPSQPGVRRALAAFEAKGLNVLDLDDASSLLARGLRPSDVVTRERARTRRWALAAYEERAWDGIRWWSFHDPDGGAYGLWSAKTLALQRVEPLRVDHPAVVEAAAMLDRPVATA